MLMVGEVLLPRGAQVHHLPTDGSTGYKAHLKGEPLFPDFHHEIAIRVNLGSDRFVY